MSHFSVPLTLLKMGLALSLVFSLSTSSKATHIVGGEFELVHLQDFEYELKLIQYFDVINGNPGAEDQLVSVFIFRKGDNEFVRSVILTLVDRRPVFYTQPECAIGELKTRKLTYSKTITLDPETFGDPAGYYVVFERCCRNNVMTNIFLPAANTVGQTFFLEFPPVVKDGKAFQNSSPILFPPLSDYACVNQLYYFDFAGSDPDGDSIVYSLSNPLNSSAIIALPTPTPAPHNEVPWVEGIDIENVIPGDPSLNTTADGYLTVNPSEPGLYAFALKAEEYRDGVKIGESRRDFQMLVIDCPGPNYPPVGVAEDSDGNIYYSLDETIVLGYNDSKCIDIHITDLNSFDLEKIESIRLQLYPKNFAGDISDLLPIDSLALTNDQDSATIRICFPDCPYTEGPAEIELKISDSTCPLPLTDLLQLSVVVEPPPNQDPYFVATSNVVDTLLEGDVIEFDVHGADDDLDSVYFEIYSKGFELADFGMEFHSITQGPGFIDGKFSWDTGCDVNNFGLFNDFELYILVHDYDQCQDANPDSIRVDLHVFLPSNSDPLLSTSLLEPEVNGFIDVELTVPFSINFNVFATDSDGDSVFLEAISTSEISLEELGMEFSSESGLSTTQSTFDWSNTCDLLDPLVDNIFPVQFIATDADVCKIPNSDTLTVNFTVLPPPNESPFISIVELESNAITVSPGTTVELTLQGIDMDNDAITLELVGNSVNVGPNDFSFLPTQGNGEVNSTFSFITSCDAYYVDAQRKYQFSFKVTDDYCLLPNSEELTLTINLFDPLSVVDEFRPPNVCTPNGDGYNDFFTLPNLPLDNCFIQFKGISIINRWGRVVFESGSREFIWDPSNDPVGVYFYTLDFGTDEFKGLISVLY